MPSANADVAYVLRCQILAVLPNVTPDAVMSSKIGKMVHRVRKQAVSWGFDDVVSELAGWIVKKWKSDFDIKSSKASREANDLSSKMSNGGDKDPSDKAAKKEKRREKSELTSQKASSTQSKDERNDTDGVHKKRSNSVNHLRDLMSTSALFNDGFVI